MRDWSATCHSVNTKKSQSQGSHGSSTFVERCDQTRTAVTVLQFPNGNGGLLMD